MIKRTYDIKKKTEANYGWNCDIYTTMGVANLVEDKVLSPLVTMVTPLVKEFGKAFGVDSKNIKCTDFWINISAPGDFQEYHVHPNSHFSAVVYLKTSPNCGDIIFKSFSSDGDMFQLPMRSLNQNNFSFCHYTPEDLKVLVFRSNLKHMVKRNNSKEDRISTAFNFVA